MHKIEKGIPMWSRAASAWNFGEMEVGDSVWLELDKMPSAAAAYGKLTKAKGWKFGRRRDGDGYRVWRVS